MKFLYEYRTPDNVGHSGVIDAPNRDAAFAMLKARGVRASRMTVAPGFFNNLFGRGKRWLAIAVLAVLCVTLAIMVGRVVLNAPQPSSVEVSLDSTVRRQMIGDTAVIEQGIRTGWADVFALEGERFLASFAIPGVPAGQRSTTEEKLLEALHSTPTPTTYTSGSASLEARQIRAMVSGMKDELRQFLAEGGTIAEYGRRLVQRQEEELGYYNRAKAEIDAAAKSDMPEVRLTELWEKRNASLRRMGIKLVPMPE